MTSRFPCVVLIRCFTAAFVHILSVYLITCACALLIVVDFYLWKFVCLFLTLPVTLSSVCSFVLRLLTLSLTLSRVKRERCNRIFAVGHCVFAPVLRGYSTFLLTSASFLAVGVSDLRTLSAPLTVSSAWILLILATGLRLRSRPCEE